MMRIIISALVGICVGVSIAIFGPANEAEYREFIPPEPVGVSPSQCLPESNLEAASIDERESTQRLLDEVERLESEIERLSASPPDPLGGQDWLREAWADLATSEPNVDMQQQLVDGGFDSARADWLVQRESELQAAVIESGGGLPMDHLQNGLLARQALRDEIGDYEYEQYLAATGQSTIVAVTRVLPDSPAEAGGLQVGDEIIDYDGERVFNVFDLSGAAGEGAPGGSVVVNISRDGAPMQLVVPRGSLGISAGRPRR